MEEYKNHLQMVFQKLKENHLYVKQEKCSFAQQRIHFSGHVIEYKVWKKARLWWYVIEKYQRQLQYYAFSLN